MESLGLSAGAFFFGFVTRASEARLEVSGLPVLSKGQVYSNGKSGVVIQDVEFAESKRRLAQNERQLQQAKRALEKLEREASSRAVPREWREPISKDQ